jgi:bisphosphoglycerate-independent phosphoglycerate mutase (AlkP superfamily)
VHSHITHLYALLETAKEIGVPHTYIHFFGDGRDTAPRSGAGYAKDLLAFIDKEKYGEIATVIGRYYAMDRDKRWERVKIAVDGLVKGEGEKAEDVVKAIEEKYKVDETDEFLKPLIVNGDAGRIKGQSNEMDPSSFHLILCILDKMAILFSASITALTVCGRSRPSLAFQTSPWKWMFPKTS